MKYKRQCKLCGEEFETNYPQKLYCDAPVHYIPCPICGKMVAKTDKLFQRKPQCCSEECKSIQRKQWADRQRANHGGVLAFNTVESKAKTEKTISEKYQGGHVLSDPEVNAKRWATMEAKYGYEWQFKCAKARKPLAEYSFPYYATLDKTFKSVDEINIERSLLAVDNEHSTISDEIEKFFSANNIQYQTDKYFNYVLPNNIVVNVASMKSIKPWDYYLAKSHLASEKGFQCIHIFPWDNVENVLNSVLLSEQIIDYSQCSMYNIYIKVANQFLDEYDPKGKCKGRKIYPLGLIYEGELVQVMVVGKPEYNSHHSVEILRICTKPGFEIIGGTQAMFRFYTEALELDDIIAYVDLAKSSSRAYTNMGFEFQYEVRPQKWWVKDSQKLKDDRLLYNGYAKLFNKEKTTNLTDEEMMISDGWMPIYDCGRAMYKYQK